MTCRTARTRVTTVVVLGIVLAGWLPLAGCTKAGDTRSGDTPPLYQTTATIKDIMDSLVDPSADYLWDAVSVVISVAGTEEKAPQTDDEWKEAHRNAVRLVEATNLLIMPGRRVAKPGEKAEDADVELAPEEIQKLIDADRDSFIQLARGLYDKALIMLQATEARDSKALFESGAAVDEACENCHLKYWYPESKRPKHTPPLVDITKDLGVPDDPGKK